MAFEGYVHRREWSIADAELAEWPHEPGVAHLFLRDDGHVAFIIPIGPGRFRPIPTTPHALPRIPRSSPLPRRLTSPLFPIPVKTATTPQECGTNLGRLRGVT